MTKKQVIAKRKKGEITMVDVSSRPRFKSPVWKQFFRIYVGNVCTKFAVCKSCDKVISILYFLSYKNCQYFYIRYMSVHNMVVRPVCSDT